MSRLETTSRSPAGEAGSATAPDTQIPQPHTTARDVPARSSESSHGRPVLIDLFCCAGGAAKGYQRAGFYVIGVDKDRQPNYCGDQFVQADALEFLRDNVLSYAIQPAAIHASPPCQAYSDLQNQNKREYPDLIAPVRDLLRATGLPYVIENVPEAPLDCPIVLCGTMFLGLRVIRHRGFEANFPLSRPPAHPRHPLVFTHDKRKAHYGKLDQSTSFVQVTGGGNATIANKLDAMGIDWMTNREVNEAIPPAYAEFVGHQLRAHLMIETEAVAA